jgi:hypothetical protein
MMEHFVRPCNSFRRLGYWRVAHISGFFLSRSGTVGAPVPSTPLRAGSCAFCKGGRRCCRYYFICHAARPASHLRCPSPALYHLFVLPPIAFLAHRTLPRPLALDSGTDSAALSFRGCGIRCHAGTHSLAHHRTGGGNAVHRPRDRNQLPRHLRLPPFANYGKDGAPRRVPGADEIESMDNPNGS